MQYAIPQEWQDVLNEVQAIFPGAVIAGGALRDLVHDRDPKDVDIFIPVDETILHSIYEAVWDMFAGEDIDLHKSHEEFDGDYEVKAIPEDADRDLYAIFNLRKAYEYDLIFCTPEAAKIETFDINICQITYDGTQLRWTDAFKEGANNKFLKVMNVNRTDRNKARLERIQAKYPEYKVEE